MHLGWGDVQTVDLRETPHALLSCIVQAFCATHAVVALDMRGFGASDKPKV